MSGFIIIDKPTGWTSHDVVAKMRGVLKERKIGHLGTLDPLATGVLVLAVGRDATKQISQFMKLDKEYEATMELGKVSDTYDTEGKVESLPIGDFGPEEIVRVMESFCGESLQMPPAFSAKKIGGKKAYELARAGLPVELKPVMVKMRLWDISIEMPIVKFKVEVSSGTYIRSLVHDIGQKLGCGAVLTALRRTRVGDFKLEDAKKIEDFTAGI
ncbi:MAG: tRNA pseudouridine(55) synthase TruB [Patescibacteria group bacterium]